MGSDKGLLRYHDSPQRAHVYGLLQPLCRQVFVSCNAAQSPDLLLPRIEDRFLGIGPMGGILSAMQADPDAAWLTVACDLPLLRSATIEYLIAHRDPSVMATAFRDASGLPEPLITIWEPRAYPLLLLALSEGLSCPRKILMNTGVQLLHAPDISELQNVNDPSERLKALAQLNVHPQNDRS